MFRKLTPLLGVLLLAGSAAFAADTPPASTSASPSSASPSTGKSSHSATSHKKGGHKHKKPQGSTPPAQ